MSWRNAPENFFSAVRGCPRPCARTDPWFRGQTLPVPGHGGGGVVQLVGGFSLQLSLLHDCTGCHYCAFSRLFAVPRKGKPAYSHHPGINNDMVMIPQTHHILVQTSQPK